MPERPRFDQLRRRGKDLPSALEPAASDRSADEWLEPLRMASWGAGGALLILACLAPRLVGDVRALLLPGVPGLCLLGLSHLAGRPSRRRRALLLATAISGFLALATAPGLSGLGSGGAVWLQPAALVIALVHLAVAQQAWAASAPVRRREEAEQALRDEL